MMLRLDWVSGCVWHVTSFLDFARFLLFFVLFFIFLD
jgi:hypothetical protein